MCCGASLKTSPELLVLNLVERKKITADHLNRLRKRSRRRSHELGLYCSGEWSDCECDVVPGPFGCCFTSRRAAAGMRPRAMWCGG